MSVEQGSTLEAQGIARRIAAQLRAHPEHWTQGVPARDAQGTQVAYSSPEAVCWCLQSLIVRELRRSARESFILDILSVFEEAIAKLYSPDGAKIGHVRWQDQKERTVADIIAVCDLVATS